MLTIRRGRLARPVTTIKSSPNPVLRGSLASAEPFLPVFVKLTNQPTFFIELVCSWLGLSIGLPIPQPCIVEVHRNKVPSGLSWPVTDAHAGHFFGSLEIRGAQQLSRMPAAMERELAKWHLLELAAAFDQLIANDDRSAGNLLVAPDRSIYLIDHGRALGGAGNRIFSSDVTPLFTNYFLEIIARKTIVEREGSRRLLIQACMKLQNAIMQIPYPQLGIPPDFERQIRDYLDKRMSILMATLMGGIGLPEFAQISEFPSQRIQ